MADEQDAFDLPVIVIPTRRCETDGCGTILRSTNHGRLCALCERRQVNRELVDDWRPSLRKRQTGLD